MFPGEQGAQEQLVWLQKMLSSFFGNTSVPNTPIGVSTTTLPLAVQITWNEVTGAFSYFVFENAAQQAGQGTVVGIVPANRGGATNSFLRSGLSDTVTRFYSVVAINILNAQSPASAAIAGKATTAFTASGAGANQGLVPNPGSVAGTTKFLREDATFAVPGGVGGGYATIQQNGVALVQRTILNIIATAGLLAVDDVPGTRTNLSFAAQAANTALMGPTVAPAAVPTFRTFVAADILHNVLSATHGDTLAAAVVLGDIITGNATPAWARLAGNITTAKQFLTQTGTGLVSAVPAWGALAVGDVPAHSVLSAQHGDTLAAAVVRGDLIVGNATPVWSRLAKGAVGTYPRAGALDTVSSTLPAPDIPANITPVTVNANSLLAQNLQSLVVPANILNVVGQTIWLTCYGVYSTQALQTPLVTLAVTLGGVSLFTETSVATLASQVNAVWQILLTISTVTTGAAGTLEVHGSLPINDATAPGANMNNYPDLNTAPSAAINLTLDNTLQVTIAFSTQPAAAPFNAATGRLLAVK